MATRKTSPRERGLRPAAEDLETRQLLAATVAGTDVDGDHWTLKLLGPGSMTVTKQPDLNGTPSPLNSTTEIDSIVVGGTDPLASRLIGTVDKGPNGDGKIFFNTFNQLEGRSVRFASGLGILSINMPAFWLGSTTATGATGAVTPSMTIFDGVSTLRFGGVDTLHNQTNPAPSTATSDLYSVTLGLPAAGGSRIVINRSITSTQQVTPSSGTPTTIQHGVVFAVSGRLDLFQADQIDGDAANPPGQFADHVSTATGTGGTIVASETGGVGPFLDQLADLIGGVTGAIGNVRIGGNATNFTTLVQDSTGVSGAKINNFSVGGETKNVLVVAPNGIHNAAFGKGMDTVDIATHVINTLQANRGAIESNVFVDRTISQVWLGGDVENTTVLTGAKQDFNTVLQNITGVAATGATSPTPPPFPTNAQIGGGMSVLIAGDVTDSVFTASVEPFNGTFGDPNQVILPTGQIAAKIEGTIDNTITTPSQPNTAFYANEVHLNRGPVVPPNVPEPPYLGPNRPTHLPGLHNPLRIQQLKGLATLPPKTKFFTGGVGKPRGPRGIKLG